MPELSFRLIMDTGDASVKLSEIKRETEDVKGAVESPKKLKIDASQALASIRDVTVAVAGVAQAISGISAGINRLLDAELGQRRSLILATQAFGEAAEEMSAFAGQLQGLTNFEDDQLLALMAKLGAAFKLSKEDVKALTPVLLDFTEAFSSTGMTIESAIDLMGRALNGNTAMLGRYGIELDKTRLEMEGVSYLVEKLGGDYGGTAEALADLRTQNRNAWGDIQETIGGMLAEIIHPVLQGVKALMDGFNSLSPVMQGIVAGVALAIPVIVTLTTTITALTAAVSALKVAINPVVGIISLVTGAVVTGAVAIGAYSAATKTSTSAIEAQKKAAIDQRVQFEKLIMIYTDLHHVQDRSEQQQKKYLEVINELMVKYPNYLGKIDLERSRWNEISAAIKIARTQLQAYINLKIQEAVVKDMENQIVDVSTKIVEAESRLYSLRAEFAAGTKSAMKTVTTVADPLHGGGYPGTATVLSKWGIEAMELEGKIKKLTAEQEKLNKVMQQRVKIAQDIYAVPPTDENKGFGITNTGDSKKTTPADTDSSETEIRLREAENLMEELAKLRQTETEQLDAEYERRKAIILKHTEEESEAQKQALEDLGVWREKKEAEITERETGLVNEKFRAEIAHLSNLQEMGISSYDQLKAKMEEYYTWAKENLTEEEAALVLKQLQESNLRWGEANKEREDREREHQRTLADIRSEWADRNLSEEEQDLNAQLTSLERHFEDKKALMIEAGMTETEIEQWIAEQREKIVEESEDRIQQKKMDKGAQLLDKTSQIMGKLGDAQNKESRRGFKTWKAMATAQAMVDTASSVLGAFRSQISIPILGPILAAAEAAAAAIFGMKQIDEIQKTEYEPPQAAEGGYLDGPGHDHGGVLIEAEGGEFVVKKSRVSALGKGLFDFINFAPLAAVRDALAGLRYPNIPMPAFAGAFAGGGSVAGSPNMMNALLSVITDLSDKIDRLDVKPVIQVNVDPLSNDPVRVSEINDAGNRIRGKI